MTVNNVPVYILSEGGRQNGKGKLFKILNGIGDQDFESVEECVSYINGFKDAVEADYEVSEDEEWEELRKEQNGE